MIDFIKKVAVEAGNKILKTAPKIKEEKQGAGNWMTDADIASENFIIDSIRSKFSDHHIYAEETATQIITPEKKENLWIIDPLDGTTNAKFRLPFFSVSIALMQRGVLQLGIVYDPSRNEMFWAEKGKGAFLNDQSIKVLNNEVFNDTIVDVGSPYLPENFQKIYPAGTLFYKEGARIVNLGSAALECAYVACGRLALYYETGLKIWDVAAGKLILEEAGGVVSSIRSEIDLFRQDEFIAGNRSLVARARELLAKG